MIFYVDNEYTTASALWSGFSPIGPSDQRALESEKGRRMV
jgi:hypothetical protein